MTTAKSGFGALLVAAITLGASAVAAEPQSGEKSVTVTLASATTTTFEMPWQIGVFN